MISFFDYFLAQGWSLEATTALGVSFSAGVGVLAFMFLAHHGGLGLAATPAAAPALPQRVPGATRIPPPVDPDAFAPETDEDIEQTLRIVAPLEEPAAFAARVRDRHGVTWHRTSHPGYVGAWRSDHGVVVGWDTLVELHPRLIDAGVTDDPRLQLADDSIPLADIQIDDLGFVASVLADIDDEFRADEEADQ